MNDGNNRQQPSLASFFIAAFVGITIGNYINSLEVDLLTWLEINKRYIAGVLVIYSIIMQTLGVFSMVKAHKNYDGYYASKSAIYFLGAILGIVASIVILTMNFVR